MATPLRWSKQSPFQSFLLLGLLVFFVSHFILLSPSSLEDDFSGMRVINPKDLLSLLKNEPNSLASELIPVGAPPSYTLRDSVLLTSEGPTPNFRLSTRKTSTYQKEEISHMRDILVELQGGTRIEAPEAVYDFKQNEIRFMGAVHLSFASGAELFSELIILYTKPTTRILIPRSIPLRGVRKSGKATLEFTSMGLEYVDEGPKVLQLLSQVRVNMRGGRGLTIQSDYANYSHEEGNLNFGMDDHQPIQKQFVEVHEPALDLKSRTLELDISHQKELESITARNDVWFKDSHDSERISVGTGGIAVYSVEKNEILLSDFPQLYQDSDTITGDTILFHRDTETVEVKQSNAIYHNRNSQPKN